MSTKCIVKKALWLKGQRLNPNDIITVPEGAVGLLLRQGKVSIYLPADPKKKRSSTTKKQSS